MNIVDKRPERERERKEKTLARKAKEETNFKASIPEIKLVSDWRVEQEYNQAIEPHRLFVGQRMPTKKRFLEEAIKNRQQLKKLIVEDYQFDYAHAERNNFSIETDEETLATLTKEASKHGLLLEAYIRAIFYTAAFEVNETKRQREEEIKKHVEENGVAELGKGRKISPELRKELEKKFGMPKFNGVVDKYDYIDKLIDVAKEYFGV